jgi:hypothetical protein
VAVHDNVTLGSAQKLQCLKAQVKGELGLLLQSNEITNAKYGISLETVEWEL